MWRHVTDAQLIVPSTGFIYDAAPAYDVVLQRLMQLPCLSGLSLHGVSVSDDMAQAFLAALSGRLQAALLFHSPSLSLRVNRLTGLRALLIRGWVTGASLLALHQLEYVHLEAECDDKSLYSVGQALRVLLTNHSLISISISDISHRSRRIIEQFLFFRAEPSDESDEEEAGGAAAAAAELDGEGIAVEEGVDAGINAAQDDADEEFGAGQFMNAAMHGLLYPGAEADEEDEMDAEEAAMWAAEDAADEAELEARLAAVAGLPAVDQTLPCRLQEFSSTIPLDVYHMRALLLMLPALTRLQCEPLPVFSGYPSSDDDSDDEGEVPLPVDALAPLQQLRLTFGDNPGSSYRAHLDWSYLEQTRCLRVLQLSWHGCNKSAALRGVPMKSLQRVLINNRATIEQLRIDVTMQLIGAHHTTTNDAASSAHGGWAVLAQCEKLRELELSFESDSLTALFEALASAPAFRSLTLTRVTPRLLPASLLKAMARSHTWCVLRLGASAQGLRPVQLEALLPAATVDPAAARRMRVEVHRASGQEAEQSFGIRSSASGRPSWQRL